MISSFFMKDYSEKNPESFLFVELLLPLWLMVRVDRLPSCRSEPAWGLGQAVRHKARDVAGVINPAVRGAPKLKPHLNQRPANTDALLPTHSLREYGLEI